jgi:hypothetical protein
VLGDGLRVLLVWAPRFNAVVSGGGGDSDFINFLKSAQITETEFHSDTVFVLIHFRSSENVSGTTSNVMDPHSLVERLL